jgi:SAM-dependent methyltransferase
MTIELICPSCHGDLAWSGAGAACDAEELAFPLRSGVVDLVLHAARDRVARFLSRYLAVRHAERWTADDLEALLALPYEDRTGQRAWMWSVRARGLEALERLIVARFGARPLRVVERGAGVAWLSYRLALGGHDVLATDVNLDSRDGLGAARHYVAAGVALARCGAEAEHLPLAAGSVDVVVDAASFHYSTQPASIREAARVLAPGGMLAIVDSPVYSSRPAGEAMLAEWRDRITAEGREAAPSGYLVRDEIVALLADAGLEPALEEHWMGWHWTANYWRHRLLGPREPARLPIVAGYTPRP